MEHQKTQVTVEKLEHPFEKPAEDNGNLFIYDGRFHWKETYVDLLKCFKFVIGCFAFIFTNLDFLMFFISTKLLKFWDMWCWNFFLTWGRVECTLQPPPSPSSFLLDLWRIECKPKRPPPHPIKFCLDFPSKLNWHGWIFFKIYFQG